MASFASRYRIRAPRYIYRPQDRSLLRFAGAEKGARREVAELADLSESGLRLVLERHSDFEPKIGDMLKIEFVLPNGKDGGKPAAWFADIVRVQEEARWHPQLGNRVHLEVGLKFRSLPPEFRLAIQKALHEQNPQAPARGLQGREFLLLAASGFGVLVSMALLALPLDQAIRFLHGL